MASGMITTPAPTGYLDPQTGLWVSGPVAGESLTLDRNPASAASGFGTTNLASTENTVQSQEPLSGLNLSTALEGPLPAAPAAAATTTATMTADTGAASTTADTGAASMATMAALKSSIDNMSNYSSQGTGPAAKIGGGLGAGAGAVAGGFLGSAGGPAGIAVGAALGSAVGGAVGLGVGSLLDFMATADSKDKEEIESRQRAAKLAQYAEMMKSREATAYTEQQRDKRTADKALASQRMRDTMAIFLSRKTAKLVRQGLVVPGAPKTQYDTSTYRSGLAGGIM